MLKETGGKILKSTYTWKLQRISDRLSVVYQKKEGDRMVPRIFLLNKQKDGMSFTEIRKMARVNILGMNQEFSLEHTKGKLCRKHPSGSVKLSWIRVWWYERSLYYRHKFGSHWHMHSI